MTSCTRQFEIVPIPGREPLQRNFANYLKNGYDLGKAKYSFRRLSINERFTLMHRGFKLRQVASDASSTSTESELSDADCSYEEMKRSEAVNGVPEVEKITRLVQFVEITKQPETESDETKETEATSAEDANAVDSKKAKPKKSGKRRPKKNANRPDPKTAY